MGNIFNIKSKKYRVLNEECLLELEPTELRREIVKLTDEVQYLRTQLRMTDDKVVTDTYNFNERLKLIQKDLESLVINDKLLLDEFKKMKAGNKYKNELLENTDELNQINQMMLSHQTHPHPHPLSLPITSNKLIRS
jgi:hypothetical protein